MITEKYDFKFAPKSEKHFITFLYKKTEIAANVGMVQKAPRIPNMVV